MRRTQARHQDKAAYGAITRCNIASERQIKEEESNTAVYTSLYET